MAEIPVVPPEYEDEGCSATLLFWYKQEGEEVVEGEELAEVETAKAVVSVLAPESGTLKRIIVGEGEEVTGGLQLAIIQTSQPPE